MPENLLQPTRDTDAVQRALVGWTTRTLKGTPCRWPLGESPSDIQAAEAFFRTEALGPLCHHVLLTADAKDLVPAAIWGLLRRDRMNQAAIELIREQQDALVMDQLDEIGLRPLVLKGAAYARTLYPEAHLRPRCDTDLLFPDKDSAEMAWRRLAREGYETSSNVVEGRYVSRQRTCVKRGASGHALDLHWSISNTHTFVRALPYEELAQAAVPLSSLQGRAKTLSPVHSLLFACVHFFGHDRLEGVNGILWLYDILLLGRRLSTSDWESFSSKAIGRGTAGICRYVLDRVNERFQMPAIQSVRQALLEAETQEAFRPDRVTSPLLYNFHDLKALDNWAERIAWVRETLFPSRTYMRNKYGKSSEVWLPLLYFQRMVSGLTKRRTTTTLVHRNDGSTNGRRKGSR